MCKQLIGLLLLVCFPCYSGQVLRHLLHEAVAPTRLSRQETDEFMAYAEIGGSRSRTGCDRASGVGEAGGDAEKEMDHSCFEKSRCDASMPRSRGGIWQGLNIKEFGNLAKW